MDNQKYLVWLFFITVIRIAGVPACATEPVFAKTVQGIVIQFGEAQVEAAVVPPSSFRLGISYELRQGPLATSFVQTAPAVCAWETVERHGWVGVKSPAGLLLLNPVGGEWTLENARGRVLVPPTKFGKRMQEKNTGKFRVEVPVNWPTNKPVAVYGGGNAMPLLQKSKVVSRLENGISSLPYFWSDVGFSALAVTSDDNQPASFGSTWSAKDHVGSLTWSFPGQSADLYLLPAETLYEAARAYGELSGRAPVPPRWTLGYIQSMWGWKNQAYVEDAMKQFLTLKLPVDAFIYDFEWYARDPDYKVGAVGLPDISDFGWNPKLFSNPPEQIARYKADGIRSCFIRKPRVAGTGHVQLARYNKWLMTPDHKDGVRARELDYSKCAVRTWYADQTQPLLEAGVDGWWNDEGESSYTLFYYWNLAEVEALKKFDPKRRHWSLNRAFSPGTQRLGAAAWTGDIGANWQELVKTPTHLLNWSLSGMPYSACDIGGYQPETTPELLARWNEAGVFLPIMRSHSRAGVKPHFPWLWGPEVETAIRKALELRYRLIPMLYSLAHENYATGYPLMRPLVMEFPSDPAVANLSDQWLLGHGVMAAPQLQEGGKRRVYLPDDTWYRFGTNSKLQGKQTLEVVSALDEIPVYVRAGTMVPLGPVIQHSGGLPGGSLELQIYPGCDATFTLVEDDGITTDYARGLLRKTTFTWDDGNRRLSWKIEGSYAGKDIFKRIKVVVFDPSGMKELERQQSLEVSGTLTVYR